MTQLEKIGEDNLPSVRLINDKGKKADLFEDSKPLRDLLKQINKRSFDVPKPVKLFRGMNNNNDRTSKYSRNPHRHRKRQLTRSDIRYRQLASNPEETGSQHQKRGLTVTDMRATSAVVRVGEVRAGELSTYLTVGQERSVLVAREVRQIIQLLIYD